MRRYTPSARSSFSSTSSASDAEIAPAATPTPPAPTRRHRRISSAPDACEARELWRRMLVLQQRYGCYRSARMQAAVSAERAVDMIPSRACLDLLNDDVAGELPDEAWRILGRFVVEREPEGSDRGSLWR